MFLITLYALLGDDLRLIFAPIEGDGVFTVITSIALAMFTMELLLSSIGVEGYFNSFFFWLDALSTASLITDIQPIMDSLLGGGEELT